MAAIWSRPLRALVVDKNGCSEDRVEEDNSESDTDCVSEGEGKQDENLLKTRHGRVCHSASLVMCYAYSTTIVLKEIGPLYKNDAYRHLVQKCRGIVKCI